MWQRRQITEKVVLAKLQPKWNSLDVHKYRLLSLLINISVKGQVTSTMIEFSVTCYNSAAAWTRRRRCAAPLAYASKNVDTTPTTWIASRSLKLHAWRPRTRFRPWTNQAPGNAHFRKEATSTLRTSVADTKA